ncbi:MAG: transcription/translation regulatory transformer protein RfaH [Deltaproteobacteria bacterium]|nr:MAG: transcription/translation regulatory transformer protein RfaH [Deltaproteobacteria bacterium]
MDWYLVFTKPRDESRALKNLLEGGVPCYLPLLKRSTVRRNVLLSVVEPLFPRYLFVQADLENDYYKIKYTRGVCGFVDFGEGPVRVDDEIIEEIRRREKDGFIEMVYKKRRFRKNEKIAIKRGLLKDLEVVFDGYLSGDERVSLLLNSVSANIKLNVPRHFL